MSKKVQFLSYVTEVGVEMANAIFSDVPLAHRQLWVNAAKA